MPDTELLRAYLPQARVRALDTTASTNADALQWLRTDGRHGDLVIADAQTGGHGRMGRAFSSPEGGLYMTVLLNTPLNAGEITTACAVAVCRAVEALTGCTLQIKWVNDVLLRGKKLCGILCEGAFDGGRLLGVAAGIGINLYRADFPPELSDIACALYPDARLLPAPRERFAAEIYSQLMRLLPLSPAHMPEYRARCVTLGQRVRWTQDGASFAGLAVDADDEGALLVRMPSGDIRRVGAGEVSVRAQPE